MKHKQQKCDAFPARKHNQQYIPDALPELFRELHVKIVSKNLKTANKLFKTE